MEQTACYAMTNSTLSNGGQYLKGINESCACAEAHAHNNLHHGDLPPNAVLCHPLKLHWYCW